MDKIKLLRNMKRKAQFLEKDCDRLIVALTEERLKELTSEEEQQ